MNRSSILALATLTAATLVTVATSPPYYGSWDFEDRLDALQFTMESPEQLHVEELALTSSGGLPEGYWGGMSLELSVDAVQLQIADEAEPDTGDTGGSLTEDLTLEITLLQAGEEISRELVELHPGGSDAATVFHLYADTQHCDDVGDCTVEASLEFELDRELAEGEVLVVDWGAIGRISGDFSEDGQAEPELAIELSQPE